MAVMRALELIGNRAARADRARWGALRRAGRGVHEAHTVWRPDPSHVDAALAGAWRGVPRMLTEHGCCAVLEPALTGLLDGYVRALVASGRPHEFEALRRALADAVA